MAQGQTLSGQARFTAHDVSEEPAHHHLGHLLVASTSPAEEEVKWGGPFLLEPALPSPGPLVSSEPGARSAHVNTRVT